MNRTAAWSPSGAWIAEVAGDEVVVVELPTVGHAHFGAWSPEGDAVAWADAQGLMLWLEGADEACCLLPCASDIPHLTGVGFSPDGSFISMLRRLPDGTLPQLLVVRRSDRAVLRAGAPGMIPTVEWDSDEEIVVADDLAPDPEGGYRYRQVLHVAVDPLAKSWNVPTADEIAGFPPPRPVRRGTVRTEREEL